MPPLEAPNEARFSCIKINQPIGEFFIANIPHNLLVQICAFDVRRMIKERDIETYLGIQRPLNDRRVKEINQYVHTIDACFPTSVILAVDAKCATHLQESNELLLKNFTDTDNRDEIVYFRQIARVLDGQHRIAGLEDYQGGQFDVPVSIFIDIDIADQAYIFSTVNLAQTKVSKSLAYDLFELAKARSPQKTCHNIAVALNRTTGSPFLHRIKRLGTSTAGLFTETLSQATFVEALLPYISGNPVADRDLYLRDKKPSYSPAQELNRLVFRNLFIDEQDMVITDIIWNYFAAISTRWPIAWNSMGQGYMLNKTNGFNALMKFLGPAYNHIRKTEAVPPTQDFLTLFEKVTIDDDDFNVENYKPGSSGQAKLVTQLFELTNVKARS